MLIAIFKHTIMITSFVLVMMLIIEYINVQSQGKWARPFKQKGWLQILSAALLGLIPGCLGAYTAVSLYAHKIFGFAGLVTTMIATSGDEAFFMISVIPREAIILFISIFLIAVLTGSILYAFMRNRTLMKLPENHLRIHQHDADCQCFAPAHIGRHLRNISFQRAILIAGLLLFILGLVIGEFGHSHDFEHLLNPGHHHHHHDHAHTHEGESHWNWITVTFLIVSLISLFIIISVNDHFIEEHLWKHIIKKHFLKIFLWTFAALVLLHYISQVIDVRDWVQSNFYITLLIAVLIGIIPQSGPHFIFVLMFAEGTIPLSILMANSIVQDGHGALPLLAESGKSFVLVKLVNIAIGLIFGVLVHLVGF